MKSDPLFTFRLTPVLLSLSNANADERAALLAKHHLPESAAMGSCTVPLSSVRGLIQDVAVRRKDPSFGLTLAEAIPEGTYGLVELLARTAPTVAEALRALARYGGQINPVGRFEVSDVDAGVELRYLVLGSSSGLGALQNEFSIAFVVRAIRLVAAAPIELERVWFAHEAPSDAARLDDYFLCPITYGADSCGFALGAEGSALALTSSDPVVHEFLAQQAAERSPESSSFVATVCHVVEQQLGYDDLELELAPSREGGSERGAQGARRSRVAGRVLELAPSREGGSERGAQGARRSRVAGRVLERVAEHLAITPRTLQRRLSDEGTTFSKVVDGLRQQSAERLLREGVPAERAAEMLGFASAESFRRSLRRWRKSEIH
ncbi:MAG: AraC family transcriptional regulator ligand-binding domain-containing protein [Deltaproteobacteria bacterium]